MTNPKKLPELPEGWEWASDTSGHVARYGSPDRASYTHDVWIYDNQRLVSSFGAVASGNTPASVALAVLDANGLNTTANELRVELARLRERLAAEAKYMDERANCCAIEECDATTDSYRERMGGLSEAYSEASGRINDALETVK